MKPIIFVFLCLLSFGCQDASQIPPPPDTTEAKKPEVVNVESPGAVGKPSSVAVKAAKCSQSKEVGGC